MNLKSLLFVPLLLLMGNCKTQSVNAQSSVNTSNIMTLGINKKVPVPNSKISLEFKNIAEDSRCPVNVTCVWEGIAIVDLKATSGKESTDFQLATKDFQPKNTSRSFSYSGYIFTLQSVSPQPGGKEVAPSVTIKYEKEN